MLFKRIGTKRSKFTINLYPKRLTITPCQQSYIKIQLQRGDHKCITQKPQKLRKGICTFPQLPLTFQCTMFLDPDTQKYLSKPATIKIKQCDRQGDSLKTITKLTFDLADYANLQQPYLQIEFEFDNGGKLEADIEFIQNQTAKTDQEDKKSVKSQETNRTNRTDVEKVKKKGKKDRKETMDLGEIKEEEEVKKQKHEKRKGDKGDQQNNQTRSVVEQKKAKLPTKSSSEVQPFRQKDEQSKRNGEKHLQLPKQPPKNNFISDTKTQIQANLFNAKKQQTKTHKSSFDQKQPRKNGDLSNTLLLKQIQQKNLQIERLRNQNANLNEVIQKIASQPLPTVRTNSQDKLEKLEQQNRLLKNKLSEKQAEISEYVIKMRSYKEKEERMESALKRTGKEYEEVRRELEKCRYSIANLLDKCFEAGDADLIQFVEKYLELE